MIPPILLAPDNRLLGWSTADFSLYGGQPNPGVTFARAAEATPPGFTDVSAVAPSPDAVPGGTALPGGATIGLPFTDIAVPAPGMTSAFHVWPSSAPSAGHLAIDMPQVPSSTGSGFVAGAPAILSTPLPAADTHADGAHAGASDAPAGDVAAAPVTSASDIAAHAFDHSVGPVASGVTAIVPEAIGSVAPAAETLLADAVAMGAHAIDPIVADTTGIVTSAIGGVAGVADTLLAGAAAGLADTHLPTETFAGSDPASGIATLVGMVENADAFDVITSTASTHADAAVPSMLDALAADAPGLLGDAAHHDDHGLDHLVDGHGVHLGL